jgi:hypothetical protein
VNKLSVRPEIAVRLPTAAISIMPENRAKRKKPSNNQPPHGSNGSAQPANMTKRHKQGEVMESMPNIAAECSITLSKTPSRAAKIKTSGSRSSESGTSAKIEKRKEEMNVQKWARKNSQV